MRTKEKRIVFTSSKLNDTNHLAIKHHMQFQKIDNFYQHKKVSNVAGCINMKDGSSKSLIYSQSIDEFTMENIPNTSIDVQKGSKKYNIACNIQESVQNNAVRSFGHTTAWKYRNPYSISINDLGHHKNLNFNSSEKNLEGDEPQEGIKKQDILPDYREYLANLQVSCDTSSSIDYSFAAVIIIMAQATARSLWALLYMIINVAPIIQMFSFILKFAIEKVINIRKTRDLRQAAIKFSIFAVQLLSIYVCLTFIIDIIVLPILLGLPIVQLVSNIVRKFI